MLKIKKLFLFIFIILLFTSCEPIIEYITEYIYVDIEPEPDLYDSDLFGTWSNGSVSWDFFDTGEYVYYDYFTLEVFSAGTYEINHDLSTILLTEDFTAVTVLYTYEVMENYPVYGTITLRWDIGDYEKEIDAVP